jgi:hypothetical protein
MKIEQYQWIKSTWDKTLDQDLKPQLCLLFGSRITIENEGLSAINQLKLAYPEAKVVTVSTAGNIIDEHLIDDTIIATCIQLEKTHVKTQDFLINEESDEELGKRIAEHFNTTDLSYLLVFGTSGINAGNLLNGINSVYKGKVPVSGGIAGDDTRFKTTLTGIDQKIANNLFVGVAFYGKDLVVSHGSKGGWDKFGPIRKVTKANGNLLYEIDHKPVLDLYKQYLGEKAKDLPASGLLFPIAIIEEGTKEPIVRGIQNIDEKTNALILYGDIYEGQNIQLMKANFDNLIKGAGDSAKETFIGRDKEPELALLISCVARRLVLGQMTEEELFEAKNILGTNTKICGFYSYSELSPVVGDNACHLHNQTMTITTFSEK